MRKPRIASEKGQALVLIVLSMVALIAFLAMAVDGGNIYNTRRVSQNAADAAALATAAQVAQAVKGVDNLNWNCPQLTATNGNWATAKQAGVSRAQDNDFVIAADDATNTVKVICGTGGGKYIDVFVEITHPTKTSFLQVVGISQIANTVQATVRIQPRVVYANGAAIVATRNSCDNVPGPSDGGVTLNGTVDITINNGGIVSNKCCRVDGNSNAVDINGGSWTCTEAPVLNPLNTSTIDPLPVIGPPVDVDYQTIDDKLKAACNVSSPPTANMMVTGSQTKTIDPSDTTKWTNKTARYNNVDINNNGTLILKDGLYCFFGDVKINGTLKGDNVTIYMPSTAGLFLTSAGSNVQLSAPPQDCQFDTPGCAPALGGLLVLYMPDDDTTGNTPRFVMSGNATSNYEGTVLVPKTVINIAGTADMTCNNAMNKTQLIGETVLINGSGNICINYDKNYTYEQPSFMRLQK